MSNKGYQWNKRSCFDRIYTHSELLQRLGLARIITGSSENNKTGSHEVDYNGANNVVAGRENVHSRGCI